jgi:hypothetical protein
MNVFHSTAFYVDIKINLMNYPVFSHVHRMVVLLLLGYRESKICKIIFRKLSSLYAIGPSEPIYLVANIIMILNRESNRITYVNVRQIYKLNMPYKLNMTNEN